MATGLVVILLAVGAAAPATALTITRVSSPTLYFDTADSVTAAYVGYRILNDGGPAVADAWVDITGFSTPAIELAPGENGRYHLGPLAAGETRYAYFYLHIVGATAGQTHSVRLWEGPPVTGTLLGSTGFTLGTANVSSSNSNQVTSVVVSPNPPVVGGTFTITVTGVTGTIGSAQTFAVTPVAYPFWPASAYRLSSVDIVMSGSANAGSYPDELYRILPSNSSTDYVATYTFRVLGAPSQAARFFPIAHISSASTVRYTTGIDPLAYGPVQAATTPLTLSKSVNVATANGGDTVTYTLTVTNGSPGPVVLDRFVDILPTSPGPVAYVPGSAAFEGSPIADPAIAGGSTLTFSGSFSIPAGGTADLTFDAVLPSVLGTYTNAAAGFAGSVRIDSTQNPTDSVPATADVVVVYVEDVRIGVAKRVLTGPVNNGDGTYTLTYRLMLENFGDVSLSAVQVDEDLSSTFSGASGFAVNSVSVISGGLAPNPGFTGSGSATGLLDGSGTLAVGATATIDLGLTVTPGSNLGPYDNSAVASGTSPLGTQGTDLSANGADPDANGNGTPTDDASPTPVTFTEAPRIGVAKRLLSGPVNNGNGTYSLSYRLHVENFGDVVLDGVQVTDRVALTFLAASGYTVDSVTVVSGGLTPNPAYTGSGTNAGLLDGSGSLAVGASAEVDLAVTITPGGEAGPYNNSATADATSPSGTGVSDVSVDGTDPDPNGNGNPGDDASATPVTFTEAPRIGLAKRVLSGPVNNGDGTYTFTYRFVVRNFGDGPLSAVQVTDDLSSTFSGASGFSVAPPVVVSGGLSPNPTYTGTVAGIGLLDGSGSLAAGAFAEIDLAVTGTPGANLGPYNNSATARGTSPFGALVTDPSVDGSNPDPNGNGDPTDDASPTPISFTETPRIGLAKRVLSGPVNNGDGTYTFTYRFVVENAGDVSLSSVQVSDDLSSTFSGASFSVNPPLVVSGGLSPNPGFTGTVAGLGLLDGTGSLAVGGTAQIDLTVTVTPGANLGPYNNSAIATGTSPAGSGVNDGSVNGTDPDLNGNGNPGDDTSPTPISFTETPRIGLAKRVLSGPANNGDGTYTFTYRFVLENAGDVPLSAVQITDDLSSTFSGASGFSVNPPLVVSGGLSPNPGFTGTVAGLGLLDGTGTLPVGGIAQIDLTVTVTPGSDLGPYANQATASGTSPADNDVLDDSVNGADPDLNGNGNPGDDGSPTPITFTELPRIGLAKRVLTGPVNNGDGTYTLTFAFAVRNFGDVELDNLSITDDLSAAFSGASDFTVGAPVVTGGPLVANPAYTGTAGGLDLLTGGTLAVGQSGSVELTITVTPGPDLGPYGNQATASGTTPGSNLASDLSTNGSVPDANGNGDPGDDDTPTSITFTELPRIGVAKRLLSGPVNNGDGTYTVSYGFSVENYGDVPLSAVQITDDLSATFAAASGFTVDALTVTAGPLLANPGYTGSSPATGLTDGIVPLPVGGTSSLVLTLTVTPGAELGPYSNSAEASGTSPGSVVATDLSVNGADPDPDGNGNPGDNTAPTPVTFQESPRIGASKALVADPTNNGDGSFTLTYSIGVRNYGDVPLSGVQIVDDLGATFAGAAGFVVNSLVVTSGTLAENTAYDGATNTDLLSSSNALDPGEAGSVEVTLTVTPSGNLGPYANQATASGRSPADVLVSDLSTDGNDPDPDGNGNPGDNAQATLVAFAETPRIGTAKAVAGAPVNHGDGTYTLEYSITVENYGDVPLDNLQVVDDLALTFTGAVDFTVNQLAATGGLLNLNPGFDGTADTDLLTGNDVLGIGQSASISITVTVTPGSKLGPYTNFSTASGMSPAGAQVSDLSTDGTDPDPDGNGDPGNNGVATVVTFQESPAIGIAKRVLAAPINNGDGTYTLTFGFVLENLGDVTLGSLAITDDLGSTFGGADGFTVDDVLVTGGPLAADPAYTGTSPNTNLVNGTGGLLRGQTASVNLTVTVTPGSDLGPYANSATAAGSSPAGAQVSDLSTDGTNPDADGDGDATDENDLTFVSFTEAPGLGVAKRLEAAPVNNGDGTYSVSYVFLVENSGDVELRNLQVAEDLSSTFAGADAFAIEAVEVLSGPLTPDPAYTGNPGASGLLAGTDILPVGATRSLRLRVRVTPGTNLGPFMNQATGSAQSPAGTAVSDVSTDGNDPDPDGNGNPGDNSVPTSVSFSESPGIGIAKEVLAPPVNNGDGTYTVTLRLRVENTGDVPLEELQISDDLSAALAGAASFTVTGITTTGDLTPVPAYTGSPPNTAILDGSDRLETGGQATLDLELSVTPGTDLGPYENRASAQARSSAGTMVTDASTDGSDPDPDGNGNPGDNNDPTVILFQEAPGIGLAKRVASGPDPNGDGTFTVVFGLRVENTGDALLEDVQVSDDLGSVLAAAAAFNVVSLSGTNGLTVNPAYTGNAPDTLLLAGTDALAAGASAELQITVRANPGGVLGPYANQARTTARSAAGTDVADVSTDGSDPDPDGNGDPGDDSTPTPFSFSEMPQLGLAKRIVSGPVDNGNGTQTLTYEVTLTNLGDVVLNRIQVSDDLSKAFSSAWAFQVEDPVATAGGLTVNPSYTGAAPDTNLLDGTDGLVPGESGTLALTVTVNPGTNPGPYLNQASGEGRTPAGEIVTDLSTDGIDPDPDGDGDASNNSEPTPITFEIGPEIRAVTLTMESDRTEIVVGDVVAYAVTAANNGPTPISGVTLTDWVPAGFKYASSSGRLVRAGPDTTFGTGDDITVPYEPAGSGPLEFPGFDLAGSETVRITYALLVGAGVTTGQYENEAAPYQNDVKVGDPASVTVSVDRDPILDQTNLVGKVFLDRDGDGWQDPPGATEVTVKGGFKREAYEIRTTRIDRGDGFHLLAERLTSPLVVGLNLGAMPGRSSELDPWGINRVVLEAVVNEPLWTDIVITSAEGTRLTLTPDGNVTATYRGTKARGHSGQDLWASRTVQEVNGKYKLTLVIENRALTEPGLAGVRVATTSGLVMETDAFGRYHLAGIEGAPLWGRNEIFKVDESTLPAGAEFTTENPRLVRITSSLMQKASFGVRLPAQEAPTRSDSGVQATFPGGSVWATVDPDVVQPLLNVGAARAVVMDGDALSLPVRFSLYTNYGAFQSGWELLLYRETDPDLTVPVRTLSGTHIGFLDKVEWDGSLADGGRVEPGDTFFYVLRVRDGKGHVDETRPRVITFVEGKGDLGRLSVMSRDSLLALPEEEGQIYGTGHLARQTIPVAASRVRVHGKGLAEGSRVTVAETRVPVNRDGDFATELLLPIGAQRLPVAILAPDSTSWERSLDVFVPESHVFLVGLADLTVGQNNVSGSVEPLAADDRFDGEVFTEGRVALYLKGKVKGNVLLTAQLDTGEEELKNLFDNLDQTDPREVFRWLDPDRYYPVYGDGSTTIQDAPSQGKFYARVEWDRSYLMWGNFQTLFTGTEFAQYDRSLYGGQMRLATTRSNDLGQAQAEVLGFASPVQTAFAHNTFLATGGSLYYLSETRIVQGSDKVWVEVRDRDSKLVDRNVPLVRGRDYELDEIQGRIILARPLLQVVGQIEPSIIKDEPLDGNDVYLLADFEFIPDSFEADLMSYGARARGEAAETVSLGGTLVQENRDGQDYQLRGVDGALRHGRGTYLKGEYAETESRQTARQQVSQDGGLTFTDLGEIEIGPASSGSARSVEARVDVNEMSLGHTDARVDGWWRDQDAGYSTARSEAISPRTETGASFTWNSHRRLSVAGRAAQVEVRDSSDETVLDENRYSLQADVNATSRLTVSAEGRRVENEPVNEPARNGSLAGLRLSYDVTRSLELYGGGQGTLSRTDAYEENNLGTLGIRTWISDRVNLNAEGNAGNRGTSVLLGSHLALSNRFRVDLENTTGNLGRRSQVGANWRIGSGTELYGTYTLNTDRTEGRRNAFTLGQRQAIRNGLRLFTESQFVHTDVRGGLNHVFGLDLEPTDSWDVRATVQTSNLKDNEGARTDRDAVSVSAVYRDRPADFYTKLEYRRDRGATHVNQWLTTNRLDYRAGGGLGLLAEVNLSVTDNTTLDREISRFIETNVGFAYRPETTDNWQVLGKYTYLNDVPTPGQSGFRTDRRLHVLSAETLYDITNKFGIGGKVAGRYGEFRTEAGVGDWIQSHTYLGIARGVYHLVHTWDGVAEFRYLRVEEANDWQSGVLLAMYRQLSGNFRMGVGFNFTHFDDDLTDLKYDNRGWFLNAVGTY